MPTINESTSSPPPGGLSALWWGASNVPADPDTSYAGKTVLVTGSNTGLGLEAAIKFAALGASTLILAVRTLSKGDAAKASIVERTGCSPDIIRVMHLDMSSFSSVKAFAATITSSFMSLDVAVLNAGIGTTVYTMSPEGWEMTLQVNTLSTTLLAILLLPLLRKTGEKSGKPAHLEIVGSTSYSFVKPEFMTPATGESILEKANRGEKSNGLVNYALSKLLVMFVVEELAKVTTTRDGEVKVIVNVTCPGFCQSDISRDLPAYLSWPLWAFQKVMARTSEQGSRTLVSATDLGPESQGKFWKHDRFTELVGLITTDEGKQLQQKSWNEILDVLKKVQPDVESLLEK